MKSGTYKVVITGVNERWYDSNGNQIYYKNYKGLEAWCEYDSNGNEIHYKNSNGFERWYEYDSNGNEIHYKDSDGHENCWDSKGNQITKEEYDRIFNSCHGKVIEVDGKKYELKLL